MKKSGSSSTLLPLFFSSFIRFFRLLVQLQNAVDIGFGCQQLFYILAGFSVLSISRFFSAISAAYSVFNALSLQNNLISLADKTFPGVNELFSSPERADGHQKWVDFVMTFWHCDCICRVSEKAFTERCQKWCKRKGYHFSAEKALDLYASSCGHFTTLPKNDNTRLLITTAAQQLLAGNFSSTTHPTGI